MILISEQKININLINLRNLRKLRAQFYEFSQFLAICMGITISKLHPVIDNSIPYFSYV